MPLKEEILLLGKRILVDRSPVVLRCAPEENWQELFEPKGGKWYYEDGWLIGSEPENKGGILLSRQSSDKASPLPVFFPQPGISTRCTVPLGTRKQAI